MPEMDGLAVLEALKGLPSPPVVIVVSALTLQGGRLTVQALQKGAFDFITKPDTANAAESRKTLLADLTPRIKTLALRLGIRGILQQKKPPTPVVLSAAAAIAAAPAPSPPAAPKPKTPDNTAHLTDISQRMTRLSGSSKPELILIGVSTGGPNALAALLPSIPKGLGVPICIVQHMPPIFTQSLAENLNTKCQLRVCEAVDKMTLAADTIYIAPGGKHMRLIPGSNGQKIIQITDDPPENNCRPAVDYLFRSAANNFPGISLAVILTGMGNDGTLGLRLLKRHRCFVIAQSEESCVVYGMPKAAVEAGVVDEILPLEAIADRIASIVRLGSF